jgi:hypothetical protein
MDLPSGCETPEQRDDAPHNWRLGAGIVRSETLLTQTAVSRARGESSADRVDTRVSAMPVQARGEREQTLAQAHDSFEGEVDRDQTPQHDPGKGDVVR